MKEITNKLLKKNVVIVSHIFASGPALELEEYLQNRVKTLFFIGHPFSFRKDTRSFYRYYKKGKREKEQYSFPLHTPGFLFYIRDVVLTFWWLLRTKEHIHLYIGSDSLSAYIGILLKKIGKVDDVIFYTIDFAPNRFNNYFLNKIYHFLDSASLNDSKIIWNVSKNMSTIRNEINTTQNKKGAKQIIVPLGVWFQRIPKLPFEKKQKNRLVFMGHLLEKQGLELVVKAMPGIVKKIPKIQLVIIGTGEYEENLKKLVKKMRLENYVVFKGYIEDHRIVEEEIAKSVLGIAMYKPEKANYTYFADPGKIKNYLAAGVPVILTNVPPIAVELKKTKCGIICEYKPEQFANSVIALLQNQKLLREYGQKAIRFAKSYDWNTLFADALSKSL
jgi:glycosyltransferase involved in cell wall biosynthesis